MSEKNGMGFAHLRLHSEYSLGDGAARLGGNGVVARAAELGMSALGIADIGNMFGMVKFFCECRKYGIKPIIGCEARLQGEDGEYAMLFFCMNVDGYQNLNGLLSRAYENNGGKLQEEWLNNGNGDGLIALSGGARGNIGRALQNGRMADARTIADRWAARFPDRFYMEVWRADDHDPLAATATCLAAEMNLPVVATHPVQCAREEDLQMLEVRRCIAHGWLLRDKEREKLFTDKPYLLDEEAMQSRFADMPEALANSGEIVKRCNFAYALGNHYLPKLRTQEESSDDALRRMALAGLSERLQKSAAKPTAEYEERLNFELTVIADMGFADYYLIVADFVGWAKENGIPVGPGRGSGAGSLVAYAVDITTLDPLAYGLMFERFLNPGRKSLPDFDIDFCIEGRDRVIDYVGKKYGADHVAQIITFGQIGARSAVRDVGRVLGYPYGLSDRIARLIPYAPDMTLARAVEESPLLKDDIERNEEVRDLYELSRQVEGLPRNIGTHAGGVLIAPAPITEFCPLYAAADTNSMVSQMDMGDIEKIGLVKFDFLGLKTLTILNHAEQRLRAAGLADFSLENISLKDTNVYQLYAHGDMMGVFQCESEGMRRLMRRLRPDRLEDIVALLALFRPGPIESGMTNLYVNRKNGRDEVSYPHPILETALKETYGVFVYQEQVMEAARLLSGYSLAEADMLRRAMGKKKPEEMAAQRKRFVDGAQKHLTAAQAEKLFADLETFAGYGFPKAHAAAYALISYRTAYLKVYHAAAFYAATMSADMGDAERICDLVDSAHDAGLVIEQPDINVGRRDFYALDDKRIAYGLKALKSVGGQVVDEIVRVRGDSPFVNLFDFCRRVKERQITPAVLEQLVFAGAFDKLHSNRAAVRESLPVAVEEASRGGAGLFGGGALVDCREWREEERLVNEHKALGFPLSGSFYSLRQDFLADAGLSSQRLADVGVSSTCRLAGIYCGTRTPMGMRRKGQEAVILRDDSASRFEIVVAAKDFQALGKLEEKQDLLIAEGRVVAGGRNSDMRVYIDRLYTMESFVSACARRLVVWCSESTPPDKLRDELMLARDEQGSCEVVLDYANSSMGCAVSLGDKWRPGIMLCNRLRHSMPGVREVKVGYSRAINP